MNRYFQEDLHFSSFESNGKSFTFLLNSRQDHIQQFLDHGEFYELDELELLCGYAQGRTSLLDVGANIGNHSVYLAHMLNLERVIPIEPQSSILHLLRANIGLNWHPSFDLSHLGIALSDKAGWARIGPFTEANIGGTGVIPYLDAEEIPENESEERVRLFAGDDLFKRGDFDLIKMDVEGLELQAMQGLKNCLHDFDGVMFVEVHDKNIAEFESLIREMKLRKIDEYRRYAKCSNWILTG